MVEKIISTNNMNKSSLSDFTKSQLINLLLKQNAEIKVLLQQCTNPQPTNDQKTVPKPRTTKPIPVPRKSVKQIVMILTTSRNDKKSINSTQL